MSLTEPDPLEQEIIQLGQTQGVTVQRVYTSQGQALFETAQGEITAAVYKARQPDVPLENVAVYLVQRLSADWQPGQPFELLEEYVLMVDDPYWGRRIQPAGFTQAPFHEIFVMGYRIKGRILHNGEPIAGANVSLEGIQQGIMGESVFWDSLEYNELIWSEELETYVEGPRVYAPIMTDEQGRWTFICPKGHGAIYQRENDRRDDTPQTAAQPLPRYVKQLYAVYRGRKAALKEEEEAVINILSGRLIVYGEPGAWIRVGTLDEAGQSYLIPPEGFVIIEGLPAGEHNIVQFKLTSAGEWDSCWGCPRAIATVNEGETAYIEMGAMEWHDPAGSLIAGRVYERMGLPAAGIAIVPIDFETGHILAPIAYTDENGYWEAEIPAQGLGGDPWIYDERWGCLPIIGFPYSDIVLGARAYAAFVEMFKPEAWRKGERGHANFQFVPDSIFIQNNETEERFATIEAPYGGWMTRETLPKFKFVSDVEELLVNGPQLHTYSIRTPQTILQAEFVLKGQSFEAYETPAGHYRAAGYFPEAKFLLGGKIHGSVVEGDQKAIGLRLPEAYRLGIEFGEHRWHTQITASQTHNEGRAKTKYTCFADLVCPYCGGPAWRDPDFGGFLRGYCIPCAEAFGISQAMDARTYFVLPTLATNGPEEESWQLHGLIVPTRGGKRLYETRFHWRPDLYDENDVYLVQGAPGQATNAPRWLARHVHEIADGLGFGRFDAHASPPFTPGHDLDWFGELPEVQRPLGLTQMKLMFPYNYVQTEDVIVELDCRLKDGNTETIRLCIPAGTAGPNEEKPLSDLIRVKKAGKWNAERKTSPYKGCGLYVGVEDARLLSPAGASCKFIITNDVPLLASAAGIIVEERHSTPVAWQMGAARSVGGPHLMEDAVGQIFLFYVREGDIYMRRRAGLPGTWQAPVRLTTQGDNEAPSAQKDAAGRIWLYWQHEQDTRSQMSWQDGESWQEI